MSAFEYISNREIAVIIWTVIAIVAAFVLVPDARPSVWALIRAFFQPAILAPIVVVASCAGAVIYGAANIGLWNSTFVLPTVVWLSAYGFATLWKLPDELQERRYVWVQLKRIVKTVVPIEIFVALTGFSLPVELIVVPLVTVLVLVAWFATEHPAEHEAAELTARILNGLVLGVGVFFIGRTTLSIASNPESVDVGHQLGLLAMPAWLGIAMVPLFCTLRWYMALNGAFVRINFESTKMVDRGEPAPKRQRLRAKARVTARSIFRTWKVGQLERQELLTMLRGDVPEGGWNLTES